MAAAEPEACACSSSSLEVEETCQNYGNSSSDPPTEPHPDMDICHSVQDSLLSSDSRFTNYRGILNWIIILLILTHAHLFLDNFIQHGFLIDLRKVLEHLMEDNYNWPSVNMILAANIFAIAALLLERCLDKGERISHSGPTPFLVSSFILTKKPTIGIVRGLFHLQLPLVDFLQLSLIVIAADAEDNYFAVWISGVVNICICFPGTDKCVLHETKEHIEHLTIKDLYYFLLAPTLCYQRDFPFTPRVRINVLCKTMIEMVVLTQIIVGIVQQWIEPIFQRSENSFSNMDITTRVEHLMGLVAPNHFLWLIFSFLFSHSFLNFCAELLCFGDRHFYGDWWSLLVDVYLGDYFKGNYGNGLVWLCLLLGPPLAVMTYFHDHYMSHHGQHPPGLSVDDCLS
ncbi:unnamed protein product [Coregonus sp. 'balchen']|nr:unnamed protein product [Coregonus sp. 'balchen']